MRIGRRGVGKERRWRWVHDCLEIRDGEAYVNEAGVLKLAQGYVVGLLQGCGQLDKELYEAEVSGSETDTIKACSMLVVEVAHA